MSYRLTWEPRGLYREYFGDVTVAERFESFNAISGDRRFDDLRYTLSNYLQVRGYEVTPEATEDIAALHIGPLLTNPRIVIAAVAVRPDIVAAIEEFIRHGFTKAPYRIFQTDAEARQWIGFVSN
jgi:hypothetical protein